MTIAKTDSSAHPGPRPNHIVQFYENEDFLYCAVGEFLAEGCSAGDPMIVIATQPHFDGFGSALQGKGLRIDDLAGSGRLVYHDAENTLSKFMVGSMPDAERFQSVIGGVLETAIGGGRSSVRAYGEMVDLLWRGGNPEAAIRVEEMWNDLAHLYNFSLLCAYPMGNFYKESHRDHFEVVCRAHTHVVPAESFFQANDQVSRAREISRLQQQAGALEAEIEHRKQLERALRDALESRRRADEGNALLLEATTALSQSLDYEAALHQVADILVPRLAQRCGFDLWVDDGSCQRIAETDTSDMGLAGKFPSVPQSSIARVSRAGEAEMGEDPEGARSWMVVPMKLANRVLGTITLVSGESRRAYSHDDIALIAELARRCAIAIDNSRHYHHAQEANRAKDEFLATLSHELRTPLTAILGWANMLRLGTLDETMFKTAVETIERSARTQAALIDDILDLSKIVTGKLGLDMELVDLGSVIQIAIDTVRLAASAKRVRLDLIPAPRPLMVMGDSRRLQQVVWNLLSNAIKFSHPDSTVTVMLEGVDDTARLVVRDEGIGIRHDFLPHVFEAFRQAESSNTRNHGGLGLGLAIVKHFVELHGGWIRAASSGEGQGATFTLNLPLST